MFYNDHFEDVKARMNAYWNREPVDRCSAALTVSRPVNKDFGGNFYFDAEKADQMHRRRFESYDYLWEALPCLFPYFGTAGIAEYVGSKPEYTPETTWFHPCLDEPDADAIFFKCPEAFERQKAAIAKMLALSNNEYAVTVTDNCGIADALAIMRGTDNFLMDMIAEEAFVLEGMQKLLAIYKETQQQLFDLVEENNEGSIHGWMHLWAPKRCAQMQCDMSVMISPDMYKKFIIPELEELTAFLDYSVYHLDGQEQIRHLDALLSVKNLRAIQWTPVAGQPRTSDFIEVLQKIQKAGKNLVLLPRIDEIEILLDNLSSRGLHLVLHAWSKEEAAYIMDTIKKRSKDRG